MEEFVQSSGEHGIVVFSLGSMIYNLTEEKSNMVALALSQIPQKVLWRYKGKKPETLGPNTRIYDWIPQNDLLGCCWPTWDQLDKRDGDQSYGESGTGNNLSETQYGQVETLLRGQRGVNCTLDC
ncbi:hypothetical protein KIL84_001468 [Mauremys mutica]|uniref:Uncharacterized protein n=1 Tax=Mauremys mutica TaxID=74926 RepID=A0A9D3X030_9SAUR|nr:hypothetical protein KIL84_001468 [Mauremys mutica]